MRALYSLPFVDKERRLVWLADELASLFLTHFDVKQCRDSFSKPLSCNPLQVLCSVAF